MSARRSSDFIANKLEEMILTGEFGVEDRLDEVTLAEKFGVSRTPVREALHRLAHSGLVEQIPRRGVFVRQPRPDELYEMFEVMAELEALCARLAAKRIAESALAKLDAVNAECLAAVTDNDPDRYYAENELFHHIIYRESGNKFLDSEASRLHRRLQPFRRMQLQLRGRLTQSMKEHEEVVRALRKGNPEQAGDIMRQHVAVQGEKFYLLLSNFLRTGLRQPSLECRP